MHRDVHWEESREASQSPMCGSSNRRHQLNRLNSSSSPRNFVKLSCVHSNSFQSQPGFVNIFIFDQSLKTRARGKCNLQTLKILLRWTNSLHYFFKLAAPMESIFNLSLLKFLLNGRPLLFTLFLRVGNQANVNCYRPKSILPCVSKVFKKLVNQLLRLTRLKDFNISSSAQSGFHSGHGCTADTLKVLNDIVSALDSKQYFIDLVKAFDSNDRVLCIL